MIDIVLVNWNSGSQLREALRSIVDNHEGVVSRIVVVDNNSTDGSASNIDLGNSQVALFLVFNKLNIGFGAACNQGAKLCISEFILFLNPDTKLFRGSLSIPFEFMQTRDASDVGIVGIQMLDSHGRVSRTCARFPAVLLFSAQALGLNKLFLLRSWGSQMKEWDHDYDRDVDQVIGAFFLVRRALFEELKGFDERFFVYFEEVDVCYRARQAGWRSVYLATARAFHTGGGTSQQVKAARLFYSLRSRLLYGFKHFSRLRAWALVGVTLLVEPISRLVFSAIRGGREDVLNTLRAYGMLWRALPSILRGRPR